MIRLVVADLVLHARVWAGTFVVVVATGFVGALAAGLIETGIAHGGKVSEALGSTSSAVIMFTVVTALIVLSAAANLTVALQQRGYALWQLVGIRPALVAVVVFVQLGIVGALGAFVGCLLALPVFGPLFEWTFREWEGLPGIALFLGPVSILLVTAAITVVVLLGGLRGVRRASRTPPIAALRDPEPPRIRIGWLRPVLFAGTLIAVVSIMANLNGAPLTQVTQTAPLLSPLMAAVLAAAGPLLFPLVLRGWTALVPARISASWFLARHAARYRLSQSTAAVGPLMVAIALAGGLYTAAATLTVAYRALPGGAGRSFDLAPEATVVLLGGPLLLSGVAAAATVFMSGHSREREYALVRAAGSLPRGILAAAVWEAVIYTVTAALLGAVAAFLGGAVIAGALGLAAPVVAFDAIGIIAGGGFVLILVATLVPTVAGLREPIPRVLAAQ